MILFKSDWAKYPRAIAHTSTSNESFIKYSYILKTMGVANHAWPLALVHPELEHVDPLSDNLKNEEVALIIKELVVNPWYYFREVCRFPAQGGGGPMRFIANRGNMSAIWSFFNHIDYALIMPRQFGKSASMDALDVYINNIAGKGSTTQLLTKDDKLRKANIDRLKDIRDTLPPYLNWQGPNDSNNSEEVTCLFLGNRIKTGVAQKSIAGAENLGRGFTAPIHRIDELPYIYNIDVSLPVALASGTKARDIAKANNSFYATSITTTAGKRDTKEGAYAYNIIHDGMYWNEKLYDEPNEDSLRKTIRRHCKDGAVIINGTFSHRQLGKSDEWIRSAILTAKASEDIANRDFFNIWTNGSASSPLSIKINKAIKQSEMDPLYTEVTEDGYYMRWYYEQTEYVNSMEKQHHIISVDSSQGIGKDANSLTISNSRTLEVASHCTVSETSIFKYAKWLAGLMIRYPKTILVIENAASGQSIIDIVAEELFNAGEDPFKRIFNRVIGETSFAFADRLELIRAGRGKQDFSLYERSKGYFGFKTTGHSRPHLYSTVLKESARSVGHLIRDKSIVSEILGLEERNGRVDHPKGGHDDSCISWLFAQWFVRYGKELDFYGLDSSNLMLEVTENGALGDTKDSSIQLKRNAIKKEMVSLKENMRNSKDELFMFKAKKRLSILIDKLNTLGEPEVATLDNVMKSLSDNRKKNTPSIRSFIDRVNKRNSYF